MRDSAVSAPVHPTPFAPLVPTRRAAAVVVVVLFVVVFALRWLTKELADATSLLYVLPVGLASVVFGRRVGLIAASVAITLMTVWIVGSGTHLTVLGWVTRGATIFLLADLLGLSVDRLRDSEQRLGEAALRARLAWWDWDSTDPEHLDTPAGTVLEPSETGLLVTAASTVAGAAPGTTFEHDVAMPGGQRWLHIRGEVVAPGRVRGMVQDVTALHEAADMRRDLGVAVARHRDAVEINDSVVQALAVAKWSLEAGNTQRALDAIADALATAQHLVLDLLGDDLQPADDRLRSQPRSTWSHQRDAS